MPTKDQKRRFVSSLTGEEVERIIRNVYPSMDLDDGLPKVTIDRCDAGQDDWSGIKVYVTIPYFDAEGQHVTDAAGLVNLHESGVVTSEHATRQGLKQATVELRNILTGKVG